MSRRSAPPVIIENVLIVDIAADGKAIGKTEDMAVFVAHAVPGDNVDVRVTGKRKNYAKGVVIRYNSLSEWRTDPVCPEFAVCGGCKWQNLIYEKQLYYKRKQVEDCLVRIGKLETPEIPPVLAAPETFYYRNKLEFTFSSSRWLTDEEMRAGGEASDRNALGFHIPSMFDKVLDIRRCCLQPDPSNAVRLAVREFAVQENMPFFNLRTHEGFLRTLVIRTSSTGEVMLIVCFYHEDVPQREKLLHFLWKRFPEITSLMYVINPKPNDSFADLDVQMYKGKPFIMEEMEGLKFKIGPKSFYQTNSAQAYRLYRTVYEFAALDGAETVYDLYAGTGTIANFVAAGAKKVVGVELVAEAIEDARYNSTLNGICNTFFFAGDVKDVFTPEFISRHGKPDVVILDPPRAGLHPGVTEALLFAMPDRIIYVSCNPSSQARDLALIDKYYRIRRVQPIDMFPHTHHVENVVALERR
ncbi:MAG: 23S rRNA (uracil(1939)-C(5))-methyltransferase RlmD [Bacteroidales bacterium]|jgi:23S rRNA (uracil1939-C5)-methyltransferase|nr:23S rRNA (uracil(1939)-C(5))-methyltransferase RlmD [Bacteroidales bacterium]